MEDASDNRIGLGALLGAAGGILLFASTFLDWYGQGGESVTAWTSFELNDILLAVLGLSVVYAAVAAIADPLRLPAAPRTLLRVAGPLALAIVIVSIVDPPPVLQFGDTDRDLGIWLALVGGLLMTAGAVLSRYRIAVVLGERDVAPPPADPAAETETMRQPPPPPSTPA